MRRDGEQDRPLWHYINSPFKTEGESIEPKPLHPVDTLSALAEMSALCEEKHQPNGKT